MPSIAGVRFVETHGVAIEAGYRCQPPIDAAIARTVLDLAEGDLGLLHGDGRFDHIAAEHFVQATRSAVRLSVGAVDG